MSQFITGAPVWVWPLLALLLLIGLNAMRTRQTLTLPLYFSPLLGFLSLNSVNGVATSAWVWVVFAFAYLAGVGMGKRFQENRLLEKTGKHVRLAGEGLTLVVIIILFSANFVVGVLTAVAPDMLESDSFQAGFATVLALASGSFLGRALHILRAPVSPGAQ